MNEAQTRADYIDPALRAAGWGQVEGSRIRVEYAITQGRLNGSGRRGATLSADYVLEYRNTPLAVVEAKAWDKPYTEGVAQAKDYAQRLGLRFAFASNGQRIYSMNMHTGAEGDVAAFPSPDDLWAQLYAKANVWRDRFAAVPFEDKGGAWQPRYYQDVAIRRTLEAIADGRQRILLTLATGTGKTSIAFQIAWKLFHSRWSVRAQAR
jgi:type I restriction enzyme R subunit